MKILDSDPVLLSNVEVYNHLLKLKDRHEWGLPQGHKKKSKFNPQLLDLEIVVKDSCEYLTRLYPYLTENIKEDDMKGRLGNLMERLNEYPLLLIEKLMIINLLPRSMVALYAVVDECDERLGEKAEELLQVIQEIYPQVDEMGEEEEEQGEEIAQVDEEIVDAVEEVDGEVFEDVDNLEHESRAKGGDEMEIDEVAES
ncbi:DNA-directed RNA polymerase III subunit [Martiniozyma asiatica (nom. inval.)]|nr:DNA-directed RNA polymerase III subunit [Martiniozyma asiatica]